MLNVFVVDSGVKRSHEIFKRANIRSVQYESGELICSDFKDNDAYGHGTAVAGIISRCSAEVIVTVARIVK